LLVVLVPALAHAQGASTDFELAKAHYKTGEIYYERGRYPDAAREFEEAYRLSNRPELLYNMGKSYDGAGDPARALAAYRRFLAAVKQSPDRAVVDARIRALGDVVGRISIQSTVTGALVSIDGTTAGTTPLALVEANPGAHSVEVAKEGYATWRGSVNVRSGIDESVEANPTSLVKVIRVEVPAATRPAEKPVYKKWWFWVALGGAAVAVAGAVTAGVLATSSDQVPSPNAQLPEARLPQ
jgi:tetratricopeptide (TPR) repeat protein